MYVIPDKCCHHEIDINVEALHASGKKNIFTTTVLNSYCKHLCHWMTELNWSQIRESGSIQPPGIVSKDLEVICGPYDLVSILTPAGMCSFPSDL